MVKQEYQQFATVALRATAALQRTLVDHLTTLFPQSQILIIHTNEVPSKGGLTIRTTCSPGRNRSCCSSCNRLNLFSVRPVSRLTSARNSRMSVTTLGISSLSAHSSEVCFSTASRSSG